MPIVFTFDIKGAQSTERNQIQSFFERFGWENLGGSAYRYPRLGAEQENPVEDWFNHVIPAMMLFRSYVLDSQRELTKYTLDIQSSSGMNPERKLGSPPLPSEEMRLYAANNPQFGGAKLRTWIRGIKYPYKVGN